MRPVTNLPASVRQRLLDRARTDKRPFNELLQYYAMERFLYRLSQSPHRDRFILKGALMLRVWHCPEIRPTMDIDMLGKTSNKEADIIGQIRDVMAVAVTPDGLEFNAESIKSEPITEDADYEGIRIRFQGLLGSARINMQIDIGFGDIVHPDPEKADLPGILDYPATRLLGYSRETTIAEKFHAMVKHGSLNSRMKDFYDIWLLAGNFDFDGATLVEAIRLTFEQKGTKIPARIEAFDKSFIDMKQVQWAAFRMRLQQDQVPKSFHDLMQVVEKFLAPPALAIANGFLYTMKWTAHRTWV